MVTPERFVKYPNEQEMPALIEDLLLESPEPLGSGRFLDFIGNGELSVYNVTAPFELDGQTLLAARVEPVEDEFDSRVAWFSQEAGDIWRMVKNTPELRLQDPAVKIINEELVLTGVGLLDHPDNPNKKWWNSQFYKGKDINSLELFAAGPLGMKDIRLIELENGIGVFTRPQNPEIGNLGKVGFTIVNQVEDINPRLLQEAPIIDSLFSDGIEWGGVNEAHNLGNGLIGIIGHIARLRGQHKEYYPISAVFNPANFSIYQQKIIAGREHFPDCTPKKTNVNNCFFPGGINFTPNRTELYGGVADARAGVIPIEYPFLLNKPTPV